MVPVVGGASGRRVHARVAPWGVVCVVSIGAVVLAKGRWRVVCRRTLGVGSVVVLVSV